MLALVSRRVLHVVYTILILKGCWLWYCALICVNRTRRVLHVVYTIFR
jgi:hypothetical protein